MSSSEMMVREFHAKHGIPVDMKLDGGSDEYLFEAAQTISFVARALLLASGMTDDDRLFRAHIVCEEVSEMLAALNRCDEAALLDALADLQYVTEGTAITFGLPLAAALDEVHRSNMTKQVTGEYRLRDKGPDYQSPNLEEVLRCARS